MKEIEADKTISSIVSILEENSKNFDSNSVWFRGQSNYTHRLLPSIFRQGSSFGIVYDEYKMYEEFIRRYPDQSIHHKSTFEWLTLMQHYGLPTRLLDWSSNMLVALYFCCENEKDSDGALFVFNHNALNYFKLDKTLEIQVKSKDRSDFYHKIIYEMADSFDGETKLNGIKLDDIRSNIIIRSKFSGLSTGSQESFKSLELKVSLPNSRLLTGIHILDDKTEYTYEPMEYVYTNITRAFSNIVPFKAPHLNPRIRQQHGFFTFHGGMMIDGEEFIAIEKMDDHSYLNDDLIKIKIRSEYKSNLLKELNYLGIKEAHIFPEMEYQAKEIKSIFTRELGPLGAKLQPDDICT